MTQHLIMMKTQRIQERGIVPKHQVLDNEVSRAYKEDILATGMTLQLALPDNHLRNIAEKAIQTWKYHLIEVMSGTSTTFPLHLWCQAIPQAERQLLLLRQSNVNQTVSAYAYVYGPHDYNAEPFVTIGMETLIHYNAPHKNVRPAFQQRPYRWNILRTLPRLDHMDERNENHTDFRHGVP